MSYYDPDADLTHRFKQYAPVKFNSKSVYLQMTVREAQLILRMLDFIEKRRDFVFGPDLIKGHFGATPRALETALAPILRERNNLR